MATHRCRLQLLLLVLLLVVPGSLGEYVRVFRILEGVPAGTRIGYIGEAEVIYLDDRIEDVDVDSPPPVDVDLDDVDVESERRWEAGDD